MAEFLSIRGSKFAAVWLCVASTLGTTSCFFRKPPPRVFVPPPRPIRPLEQPQLPVVLPGPPETTITLAAVLPNVPETPLRIAGPPPVAAPKRPPVAASPKPAATAPNSATVIEAPAPRLTQILTAEQTREYNKTIDDNLDFVRKALVQAERKNLTAEMKDIAENIRSFQKRAEEERTQDLVTAASLARRADVLAKDLLDRLR